MRLKKFAIRALFGLFDHCIEFNMDEHITIIHAPNGYGKTIVLRMITGFFGGQLSVFDQVDFEEIRMEFDNGSFITITKSIDQRAFLPEFTKSDKQITIYYQVGSQTEVWSVDEIRIRSGASSSILEKFAPVIYNGKGKWRDRNRGDLISQSEVVSRYEKYLPQSVRRKLSSAPDWLNDLRKSIHCRLIETQRLMNYVKVEYSGHDIIPAVKTYAKELAAAIERLLAESVAQSQPLDRTFPARLLDRMRDQSDPPSQEELLKKLDDLETQRQRLARAGLIDPSYQSPLHIDGQIDKNIRKFLAEYVSDTSQKLSFYNQMLEKLELFVEIINSRFKFKKLEISRETGFRFLDYKGGILQSEALSSGEQHELVLIFELLFMTKANTLVLIDEPEISLHVAWQKNFVPDLQKIIRLTGIDAVLATHSAQIIGGYLNLTTRLRAPNDLSE